MFRIFFQIMGLMAGIGFPSLVFAWNDAGHLTISRIAWENLSVDERDDVVAILRKHPHLNSLLINDRPNDATEDEWMFLKAAIWADYVRPPKTISRDEIPNHPLYKFHRGNWHYVNFPYRSHQTSVTLPEKTLSDDTNILKQLDLTMNLLTSGNNRDEGRVAGISDDENRAVRLTWLFHLLGDLHQPLHSIALVDPQLFPDPPHTDQGGNKLVIRADATAMPKTLHWFWDEMFSTESRYDQVCQLAERLTHDPAFRPERLPELNQSTTFREWAAESYEAAIQHAYLNHELKLVLWDDVNTNRVEASVVPFPSPVALEKMRQLAQRRIALAGYRLSAKLKEITLK